MKIRSFLAITLLPLIWCGIVAPTQAAVVVVESAWIREAPPNVPPAAYMVLQNHSGTAQVLDKVTSHDFGQVEIHKTTMRSGMAAMHNDMAPMHDDMATMEPVENLSIPAHSSVTLAPGGYHLMLMKGTHPLKVGDVVDLDLHFKSGKILKTRAAVRQEAPSAPAGEHQH